MKSHLRQTLEKNGHSKISISFHCWAIRTGFFSVQVTEYRLSFNCEKKHFNRNAIDRQLYRLNMTGRIDTFSTMDRSRIETNRRWVVKIELIWKMCDNSNYNGEVLRSVCTIRNREIGSVRTAIVDRANEIPFRTMFSDFSLLICWYFDLD